MIPSIVLAAGQSARMGRPKALLPIDASGQPFIVRILQTLKSAGQDDVIVVIGHEGARIRATLASEAPTARIVENRHYTLGQLSSLQAALDLVDRPGVDAILMTLVDVPLVSAATVHAVLAAYERTHAPIVRPSCHGRHGHPVVFDRAVFDELRRADPQAGAKAVLRADPSRILDVEVDDEGAFADIDTPEEYARWIGRFPDDVTPADRRQPR